MSNSLYLACPFTKMDACRMKKMAIEDVKAGWYWARHKYGSRTHLLCVQVYIFGSGPLKVANANGESESLEDRTFYAPCLPVETCAAIHSGDSVVVDRKVLKMYLDFSGPMTIGELMIKYGARVDNYLMRTTLRKALTRSTGPTGVAG